MQLNVSTRPRTTRAVMSQKFVPSESFVPGKMIDHADKRLVGVEIADRLQHLLLAHLGGRLRVGRGEDAAIHRHQMRRENDFDRRARGHAQNLLDLRRVAMPADVVGRDALVALGIMGGELQRAAGPGDAALRVDDDRLRIDQPGLQQRRQRQNGRGRIAARIGHQLRRRNLLAEQLRQSVDDLAQPLRVGVFLAVPLGVDLGVVQAIVGAEIDDPAAGVQQMRE